MAYVHDFKYLLWPRFIDWLIDWLIGWLIDWLIHSFIHNFIFIGILEYSVSAMNVSDDWFDVVSAFSIFASYL